MTDNKESMGHGSWLTLFYVGIPTDEIFDAALEACATTGFDTNSSSEPFPPATGEHERAVKLPIDGWSVTLRFDLDPDRDAKEPALTVGGFTHHIDQKTVESEEVHRERMDILFELLTRLAITLDTEYAAVTNTEGQANAITPTDRPFSDHVEAPPLLGVFSEGVLTDFGGVDGLYDEPWCVATLTDGRTVVIDSHSLWSQSGWEPPTEGPFIERAEKAGDF